MSKGQFLFLKVNKVRTKCITDSEKKIIFVKKKKKTDKVLFWYLEFTFNGLML